MKFGLYAPIPNVAVGSPKLTQAKAEALHPLASGMRDAQFEHCRDMLLAADALGFNLVLFAERHLGPDVAAWVLASSVGSQLENMRALVAVHPGLWDPVMTAKLAVSLDRICRSRMAINIVNGLFDEEFTMFGGNVLKGEARYERASEFITILRGLWQHETFSFAGRHYNVDTGRLLLKPATKTPPDIFSVSTSDRGRDFIAQDCDWWFVEFPKTAATTDDLMRSLDASIHDMNARLARFGRKVRYAFNPFLALGASEEDALGAITRQIYAEGAGLNAAESDRGRRSLLAATKAGCIGRPADVRRQVRRFADMGIELLLLKMVATVDTLKQVGAEVIAPLRQDSRAQADVS